MKIKKLGESMKDYHISKHQSFFCVGLNYQKADAATRGLFSLQDQQVVEILAAAKAEGLDALMRRQRTIISNGNGCNA